LQPFQSTRRWRCASRIGDAKYEKMSADELVPPSCISNASRYICKDNDAHLWK
jgi:hypothetical protein